MKIQTHTSREYALAKQAMLPPGDAWQWPEGGTGAALLQATSEELVRVESATQDVLDTAISRHVCGYASWTLPAYQSVADAAVGAGIATLTDNWVQPSRVGSRAGCRIWSHGARTILHVRYSGGAAVLAVLQAALENFEQAHVSLWFEKI